MEPLDQTEEISFEAPGLEQPVLVNPDHWVDLVIRKQLASSKKRSRMNSKNRPHIVSPKKPILCEDCIVGQHEKCMETDCPCVHRELHQESVTKIPITAPGEND